MTCACSRPRAASSSTRGRRPPRVPFVESMDRFRRCTRLALAAPSGALVEAIEARGIVRLTGLALLREAPREALLIPRCRSVHTWGMRFALDVAFVALEDGGLRVVSVHSAVEPRRFASARGNRAAGVLELPAGDAARLGLWPGRRLILLARRPSGGRAGPSCSSEIVGTTAEWC